MVGEDNGVQSFGVALQLVADEIAVVFRYPQGPGVELDIVSIDLVVNYLPLGRGITREHLHLPLGRFFETKVKRDPIAQIGHAIDLLE